MSAETMGVTPVSSAVSAASNTEGISSAVSSVTPEAFSPVNASSVLSQTIDYHPIFDAHEMSADTKVTLSAQEVLGMPELVVSAQPGQRQTAEALLTHIAQRDQTQLADVRAELSAITDGKQVAEISDIIDMPEWEGLVFDTLRPDQSENVGEEFVDAEMVGPKEQAEAEEIGTKEAIEQRDETTEVSEDDSDEQKEEQEDEKSEIEEEDKEQKENEKKEEDEKEEEEQEEEVPPVEIGPVVDGKTNAERFDVMAEAAVDSAQKHDGEVQGSDIAEALTTNADRLQSGILRRQATVGEDGTIAAVATFLQGKQFSTQGVALFQVGKIIQENVAVDLGDIRREHVATDEEVAKVINGPAPQVKPVRHI